MQNTSRVDPLALLAPAPALTPASGDAALTLGAAAAARAFPRFPAQPAFEVLLRPGTMLYIPPRWWHHVTALSLSASVSFWWGPGLA